MVQRLSVGAWFGRGLVGTAVLCATFRAERLTVSAAEPGSRPTAAPAAADSPTDAGPRPAAQNVWDRFRGPNGAGLGQASNLPSTWDDDDYAWQVELPGVGHSSPVVWNDRLFVTSGNEDDGTRYAICLDTASGNKLWQRDLKAAKQKHHLRNSLASSTPAVDQQHVYITWGSPQETILLALDHQGQEVWRVDLGPYKGGHGAGVSPIVVNDLVVLPHDHDGASLLVAVDRTNGQIRWRVPREGGRASYSTPCVYHPPGRRPELIFTEWQSGITGVDLETGTMLWQTDVFGEDEERRAIGSPIVLDDLVIGTAGFAAGKKFLVAVRPGLPQPNTPPSQVAVEEVLRVERGAPHIPTPLVYQGLLFLWADNGVVTCLELATGKQLWQQRVGGNFSGSPVIADDQIFAAAENGEVVVLAAGREYELLGRNNLGYPSRSTPAVAGNRIFFRTYSRLFCLAGAAK